MRRILLVFVVVALMAAMVAGPANADIIHNDGGSHNSVFLVSSGGSSFDTFDVDNDFFDFGGIDHNFVDFDHDFGDVHLGGNDIVNIIG